MAGGGWLVRWTVLPAAVSGNALYPKDRHAENRFASWASAAGTAGCGAERLTHRIRRLYPSLAILARAYGRHQGRQCEGAGATVVVLEIVESSLQLGREALRISGIDAEEADGTSGHLCVRAREALDRIIPPGGQR